MSETRCGCSFQPTSRNDYCADHRDAIDLTLTGPERRHLQTLLADAETEGSYYGPKAQYWARHKRIVEKLDGKR